MTHFAAAFLCGSGFAWETLAALHGRGQVEGLPEKFRFQDLRHYFASRLSGSGLDVKAVQARMRHASAETTLDTYAHLWPDRD